MTAIFICLIVCVCLWRSVLHVLFLTPKFMRALHASWLFSRYVYISHPSCCFLLLLLLLHLLCCYMSCHSLHTRFFFCFLSCVLVLTRPHMQRIYFMLSFIFSTFFLVFKDNNKLPLHQQTDIHHIQL